MSQWYPSRVSSTDLRGRQGDMQAQDEGAWERLDRLLEDLGQLVVELPAGESKAMRSLAHFFQADAAGLYLAARPGQTIELVDKYQLPASVPCQLGTRLLARGYGHDFSIVQSHMIDAQTGVWAEAARESGWRHVLDYLLPSRTARLLLAYTDRPPGVADRQVKIALRTLALAISNRLVYDQLEALDERNKELGYLLAVGSNYLTEGVIVLDAQGRVTTCNLVGGQLLGYTSQEVLGLPVEGVLASRTDVGQLVQRVLSGQSAFETCQLILYQRHGEPLSASLRIAPLRLPNQPTPSGAVVFFTERMTEQMEAAEKDLRQKNAQLKRMISILAHEIRNPLGSINAVLEYLKPVFSQDESTEQDLEIIHREMRRIDRLLRDAQLVSRPAELETDLQQMTDLLDDLLAGREKLFEERNIEVRRVYGPDLPRIWIDRAQMEQVFDNLILNAVQAMSSGGFLSIEVSVAAPPSGDTGRQPAMLAVKISDSGPGIPPEVRERIFDPFFTTKEGGTGLGLAVAQLIVTQHNGALQVESWPGIGTIFTVALLIEEELNE